jgi:uncharacterized coiled-coil protein SlyX
MWTTNNDLLDEMKKGFQSLHHLTNAIRINQLETRNLIMAAIDDLQTAVTALSAAVDAENSELQAVIQALQASTATATNDPAIIAATAKLTELRDRLATATAAAAAVVPVPATPETPAP